MSNESPLELEIRAECAELANMLVEKNRAYGNSVGDPIPCFSRLGWEERMRVRMDDKISRLMRGKEYQGDDTMLDLAGYILLMRAIRRKEGGE
jgi:hypothetical protein